MGSRVAFLLVLALLSASCAIVAKPALGAASTENSWVPRAPMQEARGSLGAVAVNGKIYAIGGSNHTFPNGTRIFVGTNEEYNLATDTWSYRKPMPTPRASFAIAVHQNKIYCIGGYVSNGSITGVNEAYDPARDTWETKAPMPTVRYGLEANAANGKIYLIGGVSTTLPFNLTGSLNEVYDPLTDSWTTKAPALQATYHYVSAVIDNYTFVIDGSATQIYNSETDIWTEGAAPPSLIQYAEAVATTGVNATKRIYVLDWDVESSEHALRLHVYDPRLETWTEGVSPPTWREFSGFAVVDDLFYAVGGSLAGSAYLGGPLYTVYHAANEQYTPFDYGTHDTSPIVVPDRTAPTVTVLSPENRTYTVSNVSLTFTVNEPVSEMAYSLDGAQNATVAGNVTLAGLPNGVHNVTVYARDQAGNAGASGTVGFAVAVPETEPFPLLPVAVAVALIAAAVGAGLLVYFKKRRKEDANL